MQLYEVTKYVLDRITELKMCIRDRRCTGQYRAVLPECAPLRPEHGAVPPTGYSKWRPVQPVDAEPVHLYLQQPDKLYRPNGALAVPGVGGIC